jgi:cell division protein FtsN
MAKPAGNKSAPPKPSGNKMFAGILAGMVIGVSMAAGLAWYVMKSPSPFVQKNPAESKPPVAVEKPLPTVATKQPPTTADSAIVNGKPRFDFYKVLTDKQDKGIDSQAKSSDKPKAAESGSNTTEMAQILQAGSFSNVDDAEKLKAKLAILGAEANIQTAAIPDKGVWYRVRLGPYKSAEELNKARGFLKQNGVDSTPMHSR